MQLPVEAQRIYMEHWLREVPYANIPSFNVEIPSGITPEQFSLITGYVIKELQDGASRNIVRMFLHNLSVENNRNNTRFLGILIGAAEYTAIKLNSRESPEETIRQAVVKTVAVAAAQTLHDFPEMREAISKSQLAEFDSILMMGAEIQKEVKQHMYGNQQPAYFLAFKPGTDIPIYNDEFIHLWSDGNRLFHPLELGYQPTYIQVQQPQHQQHQQYNNRPAGNGGGGGNFQPQQFNDQAPVSNSRWAGNGGTGTIRQETVSVSGERWNNSGQQTRQQMQRPQRGVVEEWGTDSNARTTQPNAVRASVQRGNNVTVTPTNGRSDTVNISPRATGDIEAHQSTHTWGRTERQPYPLAYDPITQVLAHVTHDDGSVLHTILDRAEEATLEYLEHELNPALKAKHIRDQEAAKAREAKKRNPYQPLDSQRGLSEIVDTNGPAIAELGENETLETSETVFLEDEDGYVNCLSLDDGINKCEQKLRKNKISTKSTFAFTANIQQKLAVTKADQDMIDEIKIREADFDAIARVMIDYSARIDKPSRLWYILNDQLTTLVNSVLKFGLGTPVTIDSFVQDGPSILAYLEKKYNRTIADLLRDQQNGIAYKALNTIKFVDEEGVITATIEESVLTAVLPVTAMELHVNFDKQNYGLIVDTKLPILHGKLRKMLHGLGPLDRVVIVTSDNVKLNVHQGLLKPGSILMSV